MPYKKVEKVLADFVHSLFAREKGNMLLFHAKHGASDRRLWACLSTSVRVTDYDVTTR